MHQHFNEFQKHALSTARWDPDSGLFYTALGLAGEAGECADAVKKVYRDDGGVLKEDVQLKIALELGDVLYYLAALADAIGFDLAGIANLNIQKREDRALRDVIGGSGDFR